MIYKYKINYKSIGGSSSTSSTSNSSKPISSSLSSSIPSLNAIDDIYNDFILVINKLTYFAIISIFKTIQIDPKIKKDHVIEIKRIFNGSEEDMEKINNLFTYLRNNKIIINEKLILKYYHKLLYIQPIINELEHSSIVSESKKIINVERKSVHVENIKKIFNESQIDIEKMNNLFIYLKKNEISIREIYYPLKYIFDNDSLRKAVNLWVSDISKAIELYNDINTWDVSQVTDMSKLFQYKYKFNDNISLWDTSNVKDMSEMFNYARSFNKPLNNWDVSNVTNMKSMFENAESFNKNIGNWNTSNVKDMSGMFKFTKSFNGNISNWNTSNVTNISHMFSFAEKFDKDIYTRVLPDGKIAWDVSNVTNMEFMFADTKSFNGNISNWNTSNVTNMSRMFNETYKFDGKISIKEKDLSTPISSSSSSSNLKFNDLTFPESMRFGATKVFHFNQIKQINSEKEIDEYLIDNGISINTLAKEDYNKTSSSRNPNNSEDKLSDMYGIIKAIDGDLKIQNINTKIVVNTKNEYLYTAWDVSNVEDISNMFQYTKLFDGDISKWNISNVSNMMDLFGGASIFNRDINTENITINNNTYTAWDVSRIENMHAIFASTEKFNGNIDMWNTSNVTDMSAMFSYAEAFNKDINTRVLPNGKNAWDVSKVTNMYFMFAHTKVFNGNISNWNTSRVSDFEGMFYEAKKFNDPRIGYWKIPDYATTRNMFFRSGITKDTFMKIDRILPYRRKIARILDMPEEYMILNIRMLTGKTFRIEVNPFDTVEILKTKIQDTTNYTVEQQRLILDNKQILDNNNTIISYEIKTEDNIFLVSRLGGN